MGVWMTVPFERAVARAIERDGEWARPYLTAWQEREVAHFAADDPGSVADLLVDGDPSVPNSPAKELVTLLDRT